MSDEPKHIPPKARRPLSRRKKFAFSLVLTVLFVALLEVVLAVAGVADSAQIEDPFLQFETGTPLYVPEESSGAGRGMITADEKLPWFNRQRFPAEKPPGTKRIFCLGGSTTYGRPYDDETSFSRWLERFLNASNPDVRWEVVNAGGISYASYRVANVLDEILAYQPDEIVVYTGHNEFLEDRSYGDVKNRSPVVSTGVRWLSHLRTYRLLRNWSASRHTSETPPTETTRLPAEVKTRLDNAIGPDDFHRNDDLADSILVHFEFNIRRMIASADAAGVPLVLVVPACNLRDFSPFKSEFSADTSQREREEIRSELDLAESQINAGRFEQAKSILTAALQKDARYARTRFLLGRALEKTNEPESAAVQFRAAVDQDVCPLRAPGRFRQKVREVAADVGAPLVDFERYVSAHSQGGAPGNDWFLDHVHPTVEGHRDLAVEILKKIPGAAPPSSDTLQKLTEQVVSGIDAAKRGRALLNLSKVLAWAGKTQEADRLALEAQALLPDESEALYQAGNAALRNGDPQTARTRYLAAREHNPRSPMIAYALGVVSEQLGNVEEALEYYRQATEFDPDLGDAWYNRAILLEKAGKPDLAEDHYRRALRANPRDFHAMNNLGLLLEKQGRLDDAREQFLSARECNPEYPPVHINLAQLAERRGKYADAIARLRDALQIDPENFVARRQLAWLLAAAPHPELRNGSEARTLAKRCVAVSRRRDVSSLEALAAASAESGDFERAQQLEQEALGLIPPEQRNQAESRLETYRARNAFRLPVAPAQPNTPIAP